MLVMDFHFHVAKYHMWKPWVHEYMRNVNPKIYEDFDAFMAPKNILKLLDNEGIDYAVLLAEIAPLTTGTVENEFIVDFCRLSERLIPFASINPVTDSNPSVTLTKLVKDYEMKGLKLLPPYQHFYPNDTTIYKLYEKAQELEIPVVFHTGTSVFQKTRLKYANPLYLDDVAVDFPDLTIVQAHGGRGLWYDIAFFLAKRHKNVYIDISGLPPQNLLKYFPDLEEIDEKVIFGSDWPGIPSIRENIEVVQKLPLKEKSRRKILGENAKKILKL